MIASQRRGSQKQGLGGPEQSEGGRSVLTAAGISQGPSPLGGNAESAGILEKDFYDPGIFSRTDDPRLTSDFSSRALCLLCK